MKKYIIGGVIIGLLAAGVLYFGLQKKAADVATNDSATFAGANAPSDPDYTGTFTFEEFAPPNQNWIYRLYITQEGPTALKANLQIDGFQTETRILASLVPGAKYMDVIFDSYDSDNVNTPFSKGDKLFSLDISYAGEYRIIWDKLQPNVKSPKNLQGAIFEKYSTWKSYKDETFKVPYPENFYTATVGIAGVFDSGYLQTIAFGPALDLISSDPSQTAGQKESIRLQPLLAPISKVMSAVGTRSGGCALPDITFGVSKATRCFETAAPGSSRVISHYFIPLTNSTFMVTWQHLPKNNSTEYVAEEGRFLKIINELRFLEYPSQNRLSYEYSKDIWAKVPLNDTRDIFSAGEDYTGTKLLETIVFPNKLIKKERAQYIGTKSCVAEQTGEKYACNASSERGIAIVLYPESYVSLKTKFNDEFCRFNRTDCGSPFKVGSREGQTFNISVEMEGVDYYIVPMDAHSTLIVEVDANGYDREYTDFMTNQLNSILLSAILK